MKTRHLLLLMAAFACVLAEARPACAQVWTQASAPIANWAAVASSADGTKMVAVIADRSTFPEAGLIFISTDSGATWSPTSAPNLGWEGVASSADGTKLVAAGPAGVYISADSGATWAPSGEPSQGHLTSSADGTKLVMAGVSAFGVFGSTNSGTTWTHLPVTGSCIASSADGMRLVTAYFAYPGMLFGGIFVSTDAGLTWTNTGAPLDLTTGWTALASSADGSKLAATIGYTDWPTGPGPIYLWLNGGGGWHASSSPSLHWRSIACSADSTKLVAAAFGPAYTSADSGASWTPTLVSNAVAVAASADGARLVAVVNANDGLGGGIWISQTTPAPVLKIASMAGNILLSWTVPSMNFVLQESSASATPNWTDVTNPPTLNLSTLQYELGISAGTGQRFYRLKH